MFAKTALLQCDSLLLYSYISELVRDLAVLGYVDIAARLIACLNEYDTYHEISIYRRDLWLLWDLLARKEGKAWPYGEERHLKAYILKMRKWENKESTGNNSSDELEEVGAHPDSITEEDMQCALRTMEAGNASRWFYPGKPSGPCLRTKENEVENDMLYAVDHESSIVEKLDGIRKIIRSFKDDFLRPNRNDGLSGLVSALHLRLAVQASLDKDDDGVAQEINTDGVPEPDQLFAWIAQSIGDRHNNIRILLESPCILEILRNGKLRQLLGNDEDALAQVAEDIEQAATERMKNGRKRSESLTMKTLLERTQHNTDDDFPDAPNPNPNRTLYRHPATTTQISEAESKLDIKLPEDYTSFLQLSNGFGTPRKDECYIAPHLHPISSVRWFTDDEEYFYGLALDLPNEWSRWPFLGPPQQEGCYGIQAQFLVGRAIEIGTEDISNLWLIPPSTIQPIKARIAEILVDDSGYDEDQKQSVRRATQDFAGSDEEWDGLEWCCVLWMSGGVAAMTAYPSFSAYLESVVEKGRAKEDEDERKWDEWNAGKWLGSVFRKDGFEVGEVPWWLKS